MTHDQLIFGLGMLAGIILTLVVLSLPTGE